MKKNIVVIPIYKSEPDWYEKVSLSRCTEVLNKHKFGIVTYKELDISIYLNTFYESGIDFIVEYFDSLYFRNINGYNRLMLLKDFYSRFESYIYILIYQLDAYVFKDELDCWCRKGYDYIGAPWIFRNYQLRHPLKTVIFKVRQLYRQYFTKGYDQLAMQERVGNGGFSLRKVKRFIEVLEEFDNTSVLSQYKDNNRLLEDLFYSYEVNRYKQKIRMPGKEVALKFSFETEPLICFKLNGSELPFGCHGWYKNEYFLNQFWKSHILC